MTPQSNSNYQDTPSKMDMSNSFDNYYNPNNSYVKNSKLTEYTSVKKQKYKQILMKYDMQRDQRL